MLRRAFLRMTAAAAVSALVGIRPLLAEVRVPREIAVIEVSEFVDSFFLEDPVLKFIRAHAGEQLSNPPVTAPWRA